MITSGQFSEFFEMYPENLCLGNVPFDRIRSRYQHATEFLPNYRGSLSEATLKFPHINSHIAAFILHGDLDVAEELISIAVKCDGDNLHTWCNQGVCALRRETPLSEVAKKAAYKMLELMVTSPTPNFLSKVDFAYWTAELKQTEDANKEACNIFEGLSSEAPDSQLDYLNCYYVKTLIRRIRSNERHDRSKEWLQPMLHKAVELIIRLNESPTDQYVLESWVWLAELQCTSIHKEKLEDELQMFRTNTEGEVNVESCIEQVLKLDSQEEHVPRICKIYLRYGCDSKGSFKTRRPLFNKVIEMGENWLKNNSWNFMCAGACANAYIQLWAMKFYEDHESSLRKHCEYHSLDIGKFNLY